MPKKGPREHHAPDVTVEINMTPMIDIVFQMILFFIIITDFTQQDIALLQLPFSTVGQEDEGEDDSRIIINITAPRPSTAELQDPEFAKKWPAKKLQDANKILIKGREYDFEALAKYLEYRGVNGPEKYRDPDKPHLCTRPVLIRCDYEQAFDYVKAILQICAQPSVAIYKIELATAEKPVEE